MRLCEQEVAKVPDEVKICFSICALILWITFVLDFKSFWLVRGDIGHGVIDIVRSLCGCCILMIVSKKNDKHMKRLGSALSYIGRYSIIALCVHIIELKLVYWDGIASKLPFHILLSNGLVIFSRFVFVMGTTYTISKCTFGRKVFGMK